MKFVAIFLKNPQTRWVGAHPCSSVLGFLLAMTLTRIDAPKKVKGNTQAEIHNGIER